MTPSAQKFGAALLYTGMIISACEKRLKEGESYRRFNRIHAEKLLAKRIPLRAKKAEYDAAYRAAHRDELKLSKWSANAKNVPLKLWRHARDRAKKTGTEFSITVEDIHVPEKCPALGLFLYVGVGKLHDGSPTLDRIDNSIGYVKGNVIVVSYKANRMKNNATVAELITVAKFYESITEGLSDERH